MGGPSNVTGGERIGVKLCSLGEQVSTLTPTLEAGNVVNLLLVGTNLNPMLWDLNEVGVVKEA